MTPTTTIITFTYNHPELFAEAAQSVLAQTYQDWTWWVVLNAWEWPRLSPEYAQTLILNRDPRILPIWYPVRDGERDACHIPARLVNWLYPKVQTPYILYLADDDLLDPEGLDALIDASIIAQDPFDGYPAVYGRCEVLDQQPDLSFKPACWCYEGGDVGLDTGIQPSCLLDGGQVLHTKALWDWATRCEFCQGKGYLMASPELVLGECVKCGGSGKGWTLDDSKAGAASNDGLLLNRLAQFARFHYVPQRIVTHRRTFQSHFHRPQGAPNA